MGPRRSGRRPRSSTARHQRGVEAVLESLGEFDRGRLLDLGEIRWLPTDTDLTRIGEPAPHVDVVLHGAVVSRSAGVYAHTVVTDVLGPGDLVGATEALTGNRVSHATSSVAMPTRLLTLPTPDFLVLLRESAPIAGFVAEHLATRVAAREVDTALLATADALTAVVWRLVQMATRWSVQVDDDLHIELTLTQEDLGRWAGASRESAVKSLHLLREQGLVDTGRRSVRVLDLAALQELLERKGVPSVADGTRLRP